MLHKQDRARNSDLRDDEAELFEWSEMGIRCRIFARGPCCLTCLDCWDMTATDAGGEIVGDVYQQTRQVLGKGTKRFRKQLDTKIEV